MVLLVIDNILRVLLGAIVLLVGDTILRVLLGDMVLLVIETILRHNTDRGVYKKCAYIHIRREVRVLRVLHPHPQSISHGYAYMIYN